MDAKKTLSDDEKKLSPARHKELIDAYTRERPRYATFATALERVLKDACAVSLPEALVQTRAKALASFAEKCVRKWDKYKPDPFVRMTDLCGGRVIVQTHDQVEAVKRFVEANFTIHERARWPVWPGRWRSCRGSGRAPARAGTRRTNRSRPIPTTSRAC